MRYLLLLLCTSCGLFTSVDFEPAIAANQQANLAYEELRSSFITVIDNSAGASDDYKTKAKAAINENSIEFHTMNDALKNFLVASGDVSPARLIELGQDVYNKWKAEKK